MIVRDLTFFQLEILKELKFKPKYGLELIKTLDVSSGRLYPNLKRLETLGLIEGIKKNNRVYYSLSEKGLKEFQSIFRWISDCVLSIGITLLDDYLTFILNSLDLKEGDKILLVSKKIQHPFLMRVGMDLLRRIAERITISGRIFMLKETFPDHAEIDHIDLPHLTLVEGFEKLPDNLVDTSCILITEPDRSLLKNCERVTESKITIIGKLYSNSFIERCFHDALKKMSPKIKPPFLIGFEKKELLETLEGYGYSDVQFSSWGGAFAATMSFQ
jgi:DNA-binding PadR family transcriptional regulator